MRDGACRAASATDTETRIAAEIAISPRLFCDLTQSWSEVGGGIGTYLRRKRRHILEHTPHRHLLIVPGPRDTVSAEGRAVTVTVASPRVPGSPHYRLMLNNRKVSAALEHFRPDLVECQDAYNLPWAALDYRTRHPEVALVAAYMTDFPNVYVERPFSKLLGRWLAGAAGRLCYRYCGSLYRRFDGVFALSENGGAAKLQALGVDVDQVALGVELGEFGPERRDPRLRRLLGIRDDQPLLIYAGRLDREKSADLLVEAVRRLPGELGARLVLLGEGPLRKDIDALRDPHIVTPGYISDRSILARWLASADIYVSAMAHETFGISIIEAQASGLPVVGVAAGAMLDRVPPEVGCLVPAGNADAIAEGILSLCRSDRASIARAACAHASQFGWDRCMDDLFRRIYPSAFAARAGAGAIPTRSMFTGGIRIKEARAT